MNEPKTPCLAYITARDHEEALTIGRALVERRLATCVNIIDGMTSVYRWKESIDSGQEAILIAKTCAERMADLTEAVRELHSYEMPCILHLPVLGGDPAYLFWLAEGVRKKT